MCNGWQIANQTSWHTAGPTEKRDDVTATRRGSTESAPSEVEGTLATGFSGPASIQYRVERSTASQKERAASKKSSAYNASQDMCGLIALLPL